MSEGKRMKRNEILFIGGCIVLSAGVIAVSIAALADATKPGAAEAAVIPGILAILGGIALGVKALLGMKTDKT